MKNNLILGVSGDQGSFSEEAGLIYARRTSIKFNFDYLINMENVLAAVENQQIDIGIFPVVNLRGGLVRMAFEAMGKHLFNVIDEVWLEINHCLLVKPATAPEQINKIVSHPQALIQCERYLHQKFKHTELVEWDDTAKAARDLAAGKLANCAVIASEQSANIYNLEILAKNIQDNRPNLTAFIVVNRYEHP